MSELSDGPQGTRLRFETEIPSNVQVSSVWRRRKLLGWLDHGPLGYRSKCRCCHRLVGTWRETQNEAIAALLEHIEPQQRLEVA